MILTERLVTDWDVERVGDLLYSAYMVEEDPPLYIYDAATTYIPTGETAYKRIYVGLDLVHIVYDCSYELKCLLTVYLAHKAGKPTRVYLCGFRGDGSAMVAEYALSDTMARVFRELLQTVREISMEKVEKTARRYFLQTAEKIPECRGGRVASPPFIPISGYGVYEPSVQP